MKLSERFIGFKADPNYKSGFGCDAKWVGTMLDDIFKEMEEKNIKILPELMELKQYLRHKGSAKLDVLDRTLWEES